MFIRMNIGINSHFLASEDLHCWLRPNRISVTLDLIHDHVDTYLYAFLASFIGDERLLDVRKEVRGMYLEVLFDHNHLELLNKVLLLDERQEHFHIETGNIDFFIYLFIYCVCGLNLMYSAN